MTRNGRGIVIVVALTLIVSAAGFALVSAKDDGENIKLTQNAEDEYVTVHNNGDESYDLSGLTLSFDDGQTNYTFDDGVQVGPGETVIVGTGAQTKGTTDYSAGYEGYLLNNTDPDTVRLFDGDTLVASTDDDEMDTTTTATATTSDTSTVTTTTTTTETPTTTATATTATATTATATTATKTATDETTTTSGTTTTTDQTTTTPDETTTSGTTTNTMTTTAKDC